MDMEMDDERQLDHPMPIAMPNREKYPYGLRLSLGDDELKKLGLDADCDEGDYLDIRAFATVKSVHKEAGNSRVELQIEKMSVECEDDESESEPDDDKDD
jgi:hypothetical protein